MGIAVTGVRPGTVTGVMSPREIRNGATASAARVREFRGSIAGLDASLQVRFRPASPEPQAERKEEDFEYTHALIRALTFLAGGTGDSEVKCTGTLDRPRSGSGDQRQTPELRMLRPLGLARDAKLLHGPAVSVMIIDPTIGPKMSEDVRAALAARCVKDAESLDMEPAARGAQLQIARIH